MIKIDYIGDNNELFNKLNDISEIRVKKIDIKKMVSSVGDAIIVESKYISISTLISVKYDNKKCYYLSDELSVNEIESIDVELLSVKNIIVIPPKKNEDQITKIIMDDIYDLNVDNNIFCFFGTDSKVGTTSVCYNTALKFSERHADRSFIILLLDGQDGSEWISKYNDVMSLPDVMVMLKNNMLTQEHIKNKCSIKDNLYIIKGETNIKESIFYHESEVNNLLSFCKKFFDAIFIDAGSIMNLYLRMTYAALIASDNRILVADQSPKSYNLFLKANEQILRDLKINTFKFIVLNKYCKSSILSNKEEVLKKYDTPVLCTIPHIDYFDHAIADYDSSEFFLNQSYKNEIINIVSYLEGKLNIKYKNKRNTKFTKSLIKRVRMWI